MALLHPTYLRVAVPPEDPAAVAALRVMGNHNVAPKSCPNCGGTLGMYHHGVYFGDALFSYWPYALVCESEKCRIVASVEPDTYIPMLPPEQWVEQAPQRVRPLPVRNSRLGRRIDDDEVKLGLSD